MKRSREAGLEIEGLSLLSEESIAKEIGVTLRLATGAFAAGKQHFNELVRCRLVYCDYRGYFISMIAHDGQKF